MHSRLPSSSIVCPRRSPTAVGSRIRRNDQARAAVEALVARGYSITAIQDAVGMSRKRIESLVGERKVLCGCGRPASHKGSCAVRYEVTPARTEAIQRETERSRRPEERERRSRAMKRVMADMGPAARSARMKMLHADRSPEERAALARKSAGRRLEKQAAEKELLAATARRGEPFSVELDCGAIVEASLEGSLVEITAADVRFLAEVGVVFARYARRKRRG